MSTIDAAAAAGDTDALAFDVAGGEDDATETICFGAC